MNFRFFGDFLTAAVVEGAAGEVINNVGERSGDDADVSATLKGLTTVLDKGKKLGP